MAAKLNENEVDVQGIADFLFSKYKGPKPLVGTCGRDPFIILNAFCYRTKSLSFFRPHLYRFTVQASCVALVSVR